MAETFKTYNVLRADREPLLRFMLDALIGSGCRIIHEPLPTEAPFRITFETPDGERIGIIAYAFLANNKEIRNRPIDEHRFQIKYGGDLSGLHEVWQDPYGLYVTLLVGINPELEFFVGADPVLHNPTRFSVSVEFKDQHVEEIHARKWFAWERERRGGVARANEKRAARPVAGEPLFEALVGGTSESFLRLIRFEREVLGEAPGERQYVADHSEVPLFPATPRVAGPPQTVTPERLHALSVEFDLPPEKVLDLIAERRMLKMAVRGSVAEEHLLRALSHVPGVEDCRRLKDDVGPDVALRYAGREVTIECKNSSRVRTQAGLEKIDLQRTRAAKSDECSRYYKPSEFDLVAACIHAVTGAWDFKYALTSSLDQHHVCAGRLSNNVKLDGRWTKDPTVALRSLVGDAR